MDGSHKPGDDALIDEDCVDQPSDRRSTPPMTPRLYIDAPLAPNASAPLSAGQAHYLKHVLRRDEGAALRLFNGRDGEFDAIIETLSNKEGTAIVRSQTRKQEKDEDLQLLFALVKRGAAEAIVQKATELGAARLTPVVTARTVISKTNTARLRAIAVEAAEQCERLTVPLIEEPTTLGRAIEGLQPARRLVYCDEAGDDETAPWGGDAGRAPPLLHALKTIDRKVRSWALLIGPEGGFTREERAALRENPYVTPASLGPRILRADTAALAALAVWQAARGDWRAR